MRDRGPTGQTPTCQWFVELTAGPDPAAYTMATSWNDGGGMPDGEVAASLSVTYPADPAGDWGGGTVTQPITLVCP